MFFGIYVIFFFFSRLKLKAFQVILVGICIAGIFTLVDRAEVIPSGTSGMFSYVKAFYEAGATKPNMIGGGIIGGMVAIPLCLGFNLTVAYAVLIGLTVVFAIIISGVTFSSLIIALKELIAELINSTKENYERNAKSIQEIRPTKKKAKNVKKGNSELFKQLAEDDEIIDDAEQLNFELDDDEDDESQEENDEADSDEEEVDTHEKNEKLRRLINRKALEEDEEVDNLELEHSMIEEDEQYEFPPVSLLSESKKNGKDYTNKELKEIAIKLQKTLESFGVDATCKSIILLK